MAVEIKYVVIREGEEKKCLLPAKKEADAYDKNARFGRGAQ